MENNERTALRSLLAEYQSLPEFVGVELTNVSQKGNFGNTPLHVAASRGNLEEISVLLQHGADPNAVGEGGATPLHDAAMQGSSKAVAILLRHRADPDVIDSDGNTPKDLARLLKQIEALGVFENIPRKGMN